MQPMNKKTFTLALFFLCLTLAWLGVNIYWLMTKSQCRMFDLVIAVLFVLAAAGMVHNEFNKKKRKHLYEVNKHKIP